MAILNNLIVNGASRFLNKAYFSFIKANTVDAEEGIFKKLTATDSSLTNITVVGLMDVQGELHTKSFTNSNIATIDGSFYITPTLGLQGENTTTNTVTVTANSLSFSNASGTAFSFESLYLENTTSPVAWSTGSSVIVTGEIQDKTTEEWMPLGTLKGTLSTYTTTSVVINNIKDSNNGTAPTTLAALVSSGTTSSLKYRNIKVSLVSINRSGLKPLGIFMTATGSNGKTFLDIYGGSNDESNTYGGLSTPVLRIGNLNGLPAIQGVSPAGWGIYTTNGFFSGMVAADRGKIGGWNIGTDNNKSLYTGTFNSDGGVYISPSYAGVLTAGGASSQNWAYTAGSTFGVTTNGTLYATSANITGQMIASRGQIGPWFINDTSISRNASGNAAGSYNTASNMYFGTSGISLGTAFKVTEAGALTAKSGLIGGWKIDNSSLSHTTFVDIARDQTQYQTALNACDDYFDYAFHVSSREANFNSSPNNPYSAWSYKTYIRADGKVYFSTGTIGGWTISPDGLYYNYAQPGASGALCITPKGFSSSYSIGGSGTVSRKWFLSILNTFGVTDEGKLYADGATIKGTITALSGKIGGWKIGTDIHRSLFYDPYEGTSYETTNPTPGSNHILLLSPASSKTNTVPIGGSPTGLTWSISVDTSFGVTSDGKLYANGVDITGTVDATSFSAKYYNGSTLTRQMSLDGNGLKLMDGSGTILSQIDGSASTIGKTSGNSYNINITDSAIDLRYNTDVLNKIDSTGMTLKNSSGSTLAEFKSYINLGTGHTNTYTGSAAMGVGLTTTKTNQIVVGRYNESNADATFIVGDGTSSSDKSNLLTVGNIAGKQITDTFVGDGSTNTFTLSNTPASTPTVIPDESSTTTYTVSSWSGTTITLNTNVVENEKIQFQYTTDEKGGYLVIGNIGGIHGKGAIIGGNSSNNSTISALGIGASIHGYANDSTMTASGYGASIHGCSSDNSPMTTSSHGASIHGHARRRSTMTASDDGASIHGYAYNNSTMTASSYGASVCGYANNSTMTASSNGASIHGYTYNSTMTASDSGTSIHGYAYNNSTISALGIGASIHGYASNSTMTASGIGTLIHGYVAQYSTMTASDNGASIHGYAYSHGTMTASNRGASIYGYVSYDGTMTASGYGASIHGYAYNSTTTASGHGASIHGYASNSTMTASGIGSVALNEATHALARAQLAIGTFNEDDSIETTIHPSGTVNYGTYAFIIGNGTSESARSNALTVDWNGNIMAQGMAGIIQMFAGITPPPGWLICDGSEILIADYPILNDALGGDSANNVAATTWGTASASEYFKLPDLRGRAPIGAGTGSGLTARTLGTQNIGSEDAVVVSHTHTMSHTHNLNSHTHGTGDSTCTSFNIQHTAKMGRRKFETSGGDNYQWGTDSSSDYSAVTSRTSTGGPSNNSTGASSATNTGGASGAVAGTDKNMPPSAVVNFIICTGKTS